MTAKMSKTLERMLATSPTWFSRNGDWGEGVMKAETKKKIIERVKKQNQIRR